MKESGRTFSFAEAERINKSFLQGPILPLCRRLVYEVQEASSSCLV